MKDKYQRIEKYAAYDYVDHSRQTHRYRDRPRSRRRRPAAAQLPAFELSDFLDNAADFVPSYAAALDPKHRERQWLIESVGPFFQDELISDVTHLVKGGKEANVYRCQASPATGMALCAAKLYRPRMLRHLKNDAIYKAGRQLRDGEGKQLKNARRERLALRKKTRFGRQLDTEWWIGNEFRMQQELFAAGADVPKPIAHSGKAILMAYLGDDQMPAPTLNDVTLPGGGAASLLERVLWNVTLMLSRHYVHGDLSAYNMLYWEGQITIIDFPQVVDARKNPYAFELFERDIARVCEYFGRLGIRLDAGDLAGDLWQRYMRAEL